MRITAVAYLIVSCCVTATASEPDTEAAALARTTQLKVKISISSKNLPLIDFLKDVAAEAEKQLVKTPKWAYSANVSRGEKISYNCKNKAIEQVLAEVLKGPGLGYVVVSNEKDKYDGFIRITKGTERGYEKGGEPSEDDKLANARLTIAKDLIKDGKSAPAKALLGRIVKDYPTSAAAKEAAKLLEGLDK